MAVTYREALVTFRDLLSDGVDHPETTEYVRGGVNLIADLFGVPGMSTSERMEQVYADLRATPMFSPR